MIPKVASHILHHTSRAAAAVQAQTTQSIRNALQHQGATTPGSSSSGWGSTGGAKHNAGGKFYNSTQTNVDGVNQANSTSSHGAGASDEVDDYKKRIIVLRRQPVGASASASPQTKRTRARSSSHASALALRGKLGVLEAVQMYARYKHTFVAAIEGPPAVAPERTHVRRNSTSSASVTSATTPDDDAIDLSSSSVSEIDDSHRSKQSSDDHAQQTEPELREDFNALPKDQFDPVLLQEFQHALANHNVPRIEALVQQFRQYEHLSVNFYNIALRAAAAIRAPGQPIAPFVAVYNEMLVNSVRPNQATYEILINVFCDRDLEVYQAIQGVRTRRRRHDLMHNDNSSGAMDAKLLARLTKEQSVHFQSASELFNLIAPRSSNISMANYVALLRSCSLHADIDQAIKIYAHIEKHFEKKRRLSPTVYHHLLGVYQNAKDLVGAQEVFAEYKEAAATGRLILDKNQSPDVFPAFVLATRKAHLRVYNRMLSVYMSVGQPAKAIELLEQMMDNNGGLEFTGTDVPPPNARSFTYLVEGFIDLGDLDSALAWHSKQLQQSMPPGEDSELPLLAPTRPESCQWDAIIEACAAAGPKAIDKLNSVWLDLVRVAPGDGIGIRSINKHIVLEANLRTVAALKPSDPRARDLLDFVLQHVVPAEVKLPGSFVLVGAVPQQQSFLKLVSLLCVVRRPLDAIRAAQWLVEYEMTVAKAYEARGLITNDVLMHHGTQLREFVHTASERIINKCADWLPLLAATQLGVLRNEISLAQRHDLSFATLRAYAAHVASNEVPVLDVRDWDMVLEAGAMYLDKDVPPEVQSTLPPPDFERMMHDISAQGIETRALHSRKRVIAAMIRYLGANRTREIIDKAFGESVHGDVFRNLIAKFTKAAEMQDVLAEQKANEEAAVAEVTIDMYHSRIVEEYYPSHPTLTPLDAFKRFEQGVANNIYPAPEAIGRLIGALGRLGEMDKVKTLYNAAQRVLASLDKKDKQWQSLGWYSIEDAMIVAFAHSGDVPSAHIHRQRILQYKGVPSADAYGALISATKDTTDDVAPALALWDESQTLGVRAHIFLYNTIISKLAKARKVDYALSLFQKMKLQGIRPSSVTFGAMISACARVGDTISAEHLFAEMASMGNYKARIPPFNTMMQMYTYTQPDRARVLWYYEQLVGANIPPNGHTYKVLMDAYGTIEPVDFNSMENVFASLCSDRKVSVAGSHWASLINAYGCVAKDLDRAIAIFDSVATHPSSANSPRAMPDAVVYEAMINVLVTLHRMDLVPQFLARLQSSPVHMTAYVANLLIKGYAAAGNIEQARATFEALLDPPEGVAAPNNHVPHGPSETDATPRPDAPVYREPSTWEAMVRAELGYGDPANVDQLLQRMESRRYPPGVINRVRGILSSSSAPELGTPITQLHAALDTSVNKAVGNYLYMTDPSPGSAGFARPPSAV
ncbi:hypothetical protein EXIGLDRAFT_679534 [Exidia glandulosa HHB12029]|uniref:Pentacotripeptide-repeat region of PRORP domain-containing protein n=1 Tax=Exidia glandulosa HHB12029 TaxID=1314781 RepID=A0A165EWH0_EXIGL|nr:hypothetical protein EXIGLDRAFT_679534 [Exidia glandulosa HHB12029]